jgi:hypothetical protein
MLRSNQLHAISVSVDNDFASGVHFQATGTGKSWIALHLAIQFQKTYPKCNILWLCEQKSILSDQFERSVLKERHFESIPQTFLLMNYSETKPAEWVENVNSSRVWAKPKLILINRAFLTSGDKYTRLRLPIHLVIHDECHSIGNATTKAFYAWLKHHSPTTRIIGFSATPRLEEPFTQLLSQYSIYDAVQDGVIVPPHISWITSATEVTSERIREVVEHTLPTLPYQKLIVWCGMMEECKAAAREWQQHFPSHLICVDMSVATPEFGTYAEFEAATEKAFLFCACKHREGSDIPYLDGCVFLDRVEDRNAKTFVQCMGRVLRLGEKKTRGWILDGCARSSYQMCERIHTYLSPTSASFPWEYRFDVEATHTVHHLSMTATQLEEVEQKHVERSDVVAKFRRVVPDSYSERLEMELHVLEKKGLFPYLLRACQILDWTQHIPHVTRGSCGSSLVCYLLGISHVDPVQYNISFARFTSEVRTSLPDIDFDFPYHLRDEVFLALALHWPGKIARISNHVYYHDKSATRQALRDMGIRGFIAKEDMKKTIGNMEEEKQVELARRKTELEDTFRGYMLHCGGITYFEDGVPEELVIGHGFLPQIRLNKVDVADDKRFKIDILSSRGLAQLHECNGFRSIEFHVDECDAETMEMLCRGDNIGITQAESCLMRSAFQLMQPRTIEHIAMCLAIIRPMAKDSRKEEVEEIKDHEWLVFDDDAITLIAELFGCSDAEADVYRRAFSKRDKKGMAEFKKRVKKKDTKDKKEQLEQLKHLHLYSFCKSHAFSYAQMVYQLAYWKCHDPKRFWQATLNHVESSYAKWVHLWEAHKAGVCVKRHSASIYAVHRQQSKKGMTPLQMLRKFGTWDMEEGFFPGCYLYHKNGQTHFYGLIAAKKSYSKKAVLYVGIGDQYVTVRIDKWYGKSKCVAIRGVMKVDQCTEYQLI